MDDFDDLRKDLALENLTLLVEDDPKAVMNGVGPMLETFTGFEQTRLLEVVLSAARKAGASPEVRSAVALRWQTLIQEKDNGALPGILARLLEIQRVSCGPELFERALSSLPNHPLEGRILAQWAQLSYREPPSSLVTKMRFKALQYCKDTKQWRSLGRLMQTLSHDQEAIERLF